MSRQERNEQDDQLKCPECRAPLKKRRARNPDACEMICGGCGQIFDVCQQETAQKLKEQSR